MWRKLRIIISALLFALITFLFLDFAQILPNKFHALAHLQLVPAIISLSIGILACWLVITLLFGRVYCSGVCPMGVFQDVIGRISRPFKAKKQRVFKYSGARNVLRWSVVGVCVLTYLLGWLFVLGSLDPYSAYGRMVVNVFRPVYLAGNNLLESIFTSFGNYTFYKMEVYVQSAFSLLVGIATLLIIGCFAWKYGRLWCNTFCPVGTILGALSKYSLFRVRIDTEKCNSCELCAARCKASCIDSASNRVDGSRCVACFNCLDSCKRGALSYSLPKRKTDNKGTDDSKRRFIAAGVATAAVVPHTVGARMNTLTGKQGYKAKHAIAPPGAISHAHLLERCTSCHLCVSKCPSNVLKPAFMEYGIGGIMQPVVYFDKGFCNFDCTVCGEVCPNGAIAPLTKEEKHLTQMGYVVFTRRDCIVRTEGTSCGACSEHCPTQAIAMVPYKGGGLTIPKVNIDICVGCGGCEFICPSSPKAIRIEGNAVQKAAKPFEEEEKKEVDLDGFGF